MFDPVILGFGTHFNKVYKAAMTHRTDSYVGIKINNNDHLFGRIFFQTIIHIPIDRRKYMILFIILSFYYVS